MTKINLRQNSVCLGLKCSSESNLFGGAPPCPRPTSATLGPSGWYFGQYFEAEVVNWVLVLNTWVHSALKKSRLNCLKSRLHVILNLHNLILPVRWGMVYVKYAFYSIKGFFFFNLKHQRLKTFSLSLSNNTKQCVFVSNKAAWVLAHIALALIN